MHLKSFLLDHTLPIRSAKSLAWLLISLLLLFSQTARGEISKFKDDMAERTRACTACHGEQGKAGPDGYYPRLAGKPAGYLYNQLKNFQEGRRHYNLMTRLVDPLSDAYLKEIADYFANLKLPYPPAARPPERVSNRLLLEGKKLALEGDITRKVPACSTCHGAQLTGIQPNVPGLLGLPLDYLNAQLGAWQTHQRKAAAPDCMSDIVQRLSSEDLVAVATWLSTQNVPLAALPAKQISVPLKAPWRCGSAPDLSKAQP
jgi:cytochrome c553